MSTAIGSTWWLADYGVSNKEREDFKPDTLEWNLANVKFVEERKGEKPILLFIRSTEMVKRGKEMKASKQYLASFKARQTVFYDRNNKGQVAKSLFNCYLMDVAKVKESDNKFLCSKNAPIIAMYGKDGTLKQVVSGRDAANFAKVYATMCTVMKDEGVDVEKLVKAMSVDLNNLYRNELKLYREGVRLATEKRKFAQLKRKNSAAEARLARAQKKYDDIKKVSSELMETLKTLVKETTTATDGA